MIVVSGTLLTGADDQLFIFHVTGLCSWPRADRIIVRIWMLCEEYETLLKQYIWRDYSGSLQTFQLTLPLCRLDSLIRMFQKSRTKIWVSLLQSLVVVSLTMVGYIWRGKNILIIPQLKCITFQYSERGKYKTSPFHVKYRIIKSSRLNRTNYWFRISR